MRQKRSNHFYTEGDGAGHQIWIKKETRSTWIKAIQWNCEAVSMVHERLGHEWRKIVGRGDIGHWEDYDDPRVIVAVIHPVGLRIPPQH